VNELITNKRTKFTEEHKEWLLTLEENQLALFVPEPEKEKKEDPPADPPQINKEQAIQVLKDEFKDPEKFLDMVPDEYAEQLRNGLKLQKAHREKLIEVILANTEKGTWSEDKLKEIDLETLEGIFNSVKTEEGDYSLSGVNNKHQDDEPEKLLPGNIEEKEEAKSKE